MAPLPRPPPALLSLLVYDFLQWGDCCLLSLPIFPRGPARVCQAAVVCKEVWLVELRGLGACLESDPTAAGEPVLVGLCPWKPPRVRTESYLDSAVRYCLAWGRKTQEVNFLSTCRCPGLPVVPTSWQLLTGE